VRIANRLGERFLA